MPRHVDEILFDPDEIDAAAAWHGGGDSMLYAISSTGSLSRGTIRPYGVETDEEWMDELRQSLEWEATEAANLATKQAKRTRGKERRQLLDEAYSLSNIAEKARRGVSEL